MKKITVEDSCVKSADESGQCKSRCAKELGTDEYVIGRLKLYGEYIEFWWKDHTGFGYFAESCKTYMFWELPNETEVYDHCLNHGAIGLIVTWPKDSDRPTAVRLPEVAR